MAYCIKCGNLLEEGAAFCSKCGNPVSGNGTSDKEVSNNEACEIVVHGRSCTVGSILKNLFICIIAFFIIGRLNYALSMTIKHDLGNDAILSVCLKVLNVCLWILRGGALLGIVCNIINIVLSVFAPDRMQMMFILKNGKIFIKTAKNNGMLELSGIRNVRVKKTKYIISHTMNNRPANAFLYFDSDSEVKRFNEELYKHKIM